MLFPFARILTAISGFPSPSVIKPLTMAEEKASVDESEKEQEKEKKPEEKAKKSSFWSNLFSSGEYMG